MKQHSGSWTSGQCVIAAVLLVFSGLLYAATEEEKLIQRIAPAGSVCLAGEACAGSAPVASAGGGAGPSDPEQIYNTYCVACHGSGANNSPIMGDATAWQPRIDKGIEMLYENALNGFNNGAMPPKGLCMDCSTEAVQATVDYILSAVQ